MFEKKKNLADGNFFLRMHNSVICRLSIVRSLVMSYFYIIFILFLILGLFHIYQIAGIDVTLFGAIWTVILTPPGARVDSVPHTL